MNHTVSSAISKLKSSTSKLNSLSDEAAETIKSVENFLSKDCSIGFDAYVEITELSDKQLNKYLEYRKIGNNYRIAVVTNRVNTDQELSVKAWSDCGRVTKIKSIKKLPDLIIDITEKVDEKITEAEVAAKTATNVLDSLTGKGE